MKTLFITTLLLYFSLQIRCQIPCTIAESIEKYNTRELYYEEKAKSYIKKYLTKEHIYNSFSVNILLDDVEFLKIPMFNMKMIDSYDYLNVDCLMNSLVLDKKFLFHDVIMFKDNKFFGIYSCTEMGDCGVTLYQDTPNSFNGIIYDIKQLNMIKYKQIFYIKGILHAWWIVQENNLMVYSLLDQAFYGPHFFLEKFYTDEKIKKIIRYNQK
jgi:hypothetical protein